MPEDLIQEGKKQMKNILKKLYLTALAVGCMAAIVMAVAVPGATGNTTVQILHASDLEGAQFPCLSANLNFDNDPNLSGLFTGEVSDSTAFCSELSDLEQAAAAPKIAASTTISG